MFRGIAAKIWLSIGIFAAGYLISVGLGQVLGHASERRLRQAADALFPIAQRSQQAGESFNRMMREFNDAVMMEDESALDRAAKEGEQAAESLRASVLLAPKDSPRQKSIEVLASSVRQIAGAGGATYGAMARAKGNLSPELQQKTKTLALEVESAKVGLQELTREASQDLLSELRAIESLSVWRRQMHLALLAVAMLISGFFARRTIKYSVLEPVARVIHGVEGAVAEVALASSQVAKSGGLVAGSANNQASYLTDTSASLTQVAVLTRSNAERTVQADRLMVSARNEVRDATAAMQKLTVAIDEISTASREVAGILRTIEELAFHTNILALNAAVEAARAGEAGAGFRVVADEVRSLAHRSSGAAQNIAVLIEGTLAKVDSGSAMVSVSSKAFSRIASAIVASGDVVTEIARSSEEQRKSVERISSSLNKMDHVTQTNAAMAQETAAAAASMAAQVVAARNFIDELAELVGIGTG